MAIYIDQNGEEQYSEQKELDFDQFKDALSKLPKDKDIIVAEDDGGFIHEYINYGSNTHARDLYHGLNMLCNEPHSNFIQVQPFYHSEQDVIVIAEIRSEYL